MKLQKRISLVLLTAMCVGQFGFVGAAFAAKHGSHSDSTSAPAASASPSPTPSPSPSESPSPSDNPSPSPSESPSPSDNPSPSPSASPSPSSSGTSKGSGAGSSSDGSTTGAPSTTGAQGCQGSIPSWVFNTATHTWSSADQSTFTCDAATGYYLSPEYYYDKQDGWYEIIPASSVAALPGYFITAPNVVHTVLGDLVVGSPDYQMAQEMGLLNSSDGILLANTGSGTTNQASVSNNGQNWVDLTSLVNVINTLQSAATTGNTTASGNTQVGSSVTGAASVIANLFNLLASAWSWSNGNLNFFTQTLCDYNQTCNGNVNLNPGSTTAGGGGQIGSTSTGSGSTNAAGTSNTTGSNVNAQSSGNIVNNVNLNAQSGNAAAADNTSAGNVSSGNALAEVNIVNLINSFISSGSSFFGVLNIFGTLNGNILFPAGFLNGLVPSGATGSGTTAGVATTGPNSTNQAGTSNTNQSTSNNTVANSIANNVTTTATTGAATSNSNSVAGNVASGAANTMQGLFNLANTSIFGDNAVLVIVNVAGHWIGKIMNLPGSSTESALLTGGATVGANTTGPGSTNQVGVNNSTTNNVNSESLGSITNNVGVNAQSGSANATGNTSVGNVNSGNAQAGSSVSNIVNSVLNVKHWFGVLVINVIGSWFGDVADATTGTAATTVPGLGDSTTKSTTTVPSVGLLPALSGVSSSKSAGTTGGSVAGASTQAATNANTAKVLTAAAEQPAAESVASIAKGKDMSILFALSAGVMLIAGALASIDKKLNRR
jgi:hypothetical protein